MKKLVILMRSPYENGSAVAIELGFTQELREQILQLREQHRSLLEKPGVSQIVFNMTMVPAWKPEYLWVDSLVDEDAREDLWDQEFLLLDRVPVMAAEGKDHVHHLGRVAKISLRGGDYFTTSMYGKYENEPYEGAPTPYSLFEEN